MKQKTREMITQTLKLKPPPLNHLTREQISIEMEIIRAAQVDLIKFEPIYKSYYPRIVAFVYQRINDKETAYEITAQVFYSAVENLKKYVPKEVPFGAWLFRIALNKLNEQFRKNKVQRTINLDEDGLDSLACEMQTSNEADLDQKLFKTLQDLEGDELELIDMRYFEKRSFKEICEITGLAESACKMRVYRVIEKLKNNFKTIEK